MPDIENTQLPRRPSSTGADLRCLGRFWRGQPGDRSHVVEFWLPPYRDLDGRQVAGKWAAGLFDGTTPAEALSAFRHHFPHGCEPTVLTDEFERVGSILRSGGRNLAA